jgi:hypothetical protein
VNFSLVDNWISVGSKVCAILIPCAKTSIISILVLIVFKDDLNNSVYTASNDKKINK